MSFNLLEYVNPKQVCVEYQSSTVGSGQNCFTGDDAMDKATDAAGMIIMQGDKATITQSESLSLPRLGVVVGAAALVGYAIWQKTHNKKVFGLADGGGTTKTKRLTISDIKYEIERSGHDSYFFTRDTMKFFGQRMKDFSVSKQDDGKYLISAPIRENGKIVGHTERLYNPETKRLEFIKS